MAHRIIYKPQGIILSSTLGDISISVEGDYVDVLLTTTAQTILSERYYAYGGSVTLYDLATLIEAEMRWSGSSYQEFTLRVFTDTTNNKADSCILHILYCDRYTPHTDVPTFLAENFLTTLPIRRVATAATVSLFFFAQKGESKSYSTHYSFRRLSDGSIINNSFSYSNGSAASASSVEQINIEQSAIFNDIFHDFTLQESEVELLSFTVRCGQRSISFFIDPSLDTAPSFYFRNCFNVWDWVALPGVTTAKTDVERSTAIINGTSQFYDQSVTKKYEVEAGPLTSDEAEWIDQLFTAYDVFRIEADATNPDDPYLLAPVLITDCTCEMQSGDEKLNIAKFTWRYADNRPVVHLSASPGIFTSPYNVVFS